MEKLYRTNREIIKIDAKLVICLKKKAHHIVTFGYAEILRKAPFPLLASLMMKI